MILNQTKFTMIIMMMDQLTFGNEDIVEREKLNNTSEIICFDD
jgi:hypothetical protein